MESFKIQFLNGGLANQAFQYIFARYYELSHPGNNMYLDDSYFAINTVHNGYELEKVFGIHPHMLSECFDDDVWNEILKEKQRGKSIPQILCENGMNIDMITETSNYMEFNPFFNNIFSVPTNKYIPDILEYDQPAYYHGYWINKGWFDRYRENFLKEFSFPIVTDEKNKIYLKNIEETQSVSIHIRRGDYVTLNWAWAPSDYATLIQMFLKDVSGSWNLFVFSDDITWCKKNYLELGFDAFESVTYVEGNIEGRNYIDLQLMSKCKGMIMSNSAFCYLAALLNTNLQHVINPTKREL